MFVDNNAPRLQGWLDQIANGKKDEDGEWIVLPNPEKAFQLFQSVVEYHVPKLARSEMVGRWLMPRVSRSWSTWWIPTLRRPSACFNR